MPLLWLGVGNIQTGLMVPHNLIKNLKTPQKATAINSEFGKNEISIWGFFFRVCFFFHSGFVWLGFHFVHSQII